jgi:hypothetical protein
MKVVLLFFVVSLLIATSAHFQRMRKHEGSSGKEVIAERQVAEAQRDLQTLAKTAQSVCIPYCFGKQ